MKLIHDQVAGDLVYEKFWERQERIWLFGVEHEIVLSFEGEADEELEPGQREAFRAFEAKRAELLVEAEGAILRHYEEIYPEYRKQFGEEESRRKLPIVSEPSGLAAIARPTHLWFPYSLRDDVRVVGLLLRCGWEPGLGLAVKFVNERVSEVGTQDIVL